MLSIGGVHEFKDNILYVNYLSNDNDLIVDVLFLDKPLTTLERIEIKNYLLTVYKKAKSITLNEFVLDGCMSGSGLSSQWLIDTPRINLSKWL